MADWGQGKAISEPDQGGAVTKWADLLMAIMEDLARLESGLLAIKLEQARLEAAGMYPAVPTESWEARNGGEARYLRMVFPMGALKKGRKLYVGADPARIAAARNKAERRARWETLEWERGRLERALMAVWAGLDRVAERVSVYRIPKELELDLPVLGTAAPVTKEPGLLCPSCGFDLGKLAMGQLSLGQLAVRVGEWLRVRPQVEYNVGEGLSTDSGNGLNGEGGGE